MSARHSQRHSKLTEGLGMDWKTAMAWAIMLAGSAAFEGRRIVLPFLASLENASMYCSATRKATASLPRCCAKDSATLVIPMAVSSRMGAEGGETKEEMKEERNSGREVKPKQGPQGSEVRAIAELKSATHQWLVPC